MCVPTSVAVETGAILDFKGKVCAQLFNTSCSPNPIKFHRCIVVDKLQIQMKSYLHFLFYFILFICYFFFFLFFSFFFQIR